MVSPAESGIEFPKLDCESSTLSGTNGDTK